MERHFHNPMRLLLLLCLVVRVFTTQISTFTDENCQDSLQINTGPNGYPDGVCTRLDRIARFGSFMLVNADEGCGVTIYGPDTTNLICSDPTPIVAELAQCYNSTYVYYSIDNCAQPPSSSITATPVVQPSSAFLGATSANSAPASTTSSSNSVQTVTVQQSAGTPVGAIVGGVVGGVVALALIGAVLFYLLVLKKRKDRHAAHEAAVDGGVYEAGRYSPPPSELDPAGLRAEAGAGEGEGLGKAVYYAKYDGPAGGEGRLRDSQILQGQRVQELEGDGVFGGREGVEARAGTEEGVRIAKEGEGAVVEKGRS